MPIKGLFGPTIEVLAQNIEDDARNTTREALVALARQGRGLLIATHDVDFARAAADRVDRGLQFPLHWPIPDDENFQRNPFPFQIVDRFDQKGQSLLGTQPADVSDDKTLSRGRRSPIAGSMQEFVPDRHRVPNDPDS